MTTGQLFLMIGFYLAVFVAVIHFTRARLPHILGALAGGAVFGLVAVAAVALGETQGWWRVPQTGVAHFQFLLWLGITVSCAPDYLIGWRVVRRFGTRGFVVCVIAVAIIGPPRDYWIAATFPAWMTFAPGITPVLADATVYVLLVVIGLAVMRMVVGSAHWKGQIKDGALAIS
jgi:Kef-type K+ transport system membrane component KefB